MTSDFWPLQHLRITTPRLELRLPDHAELTALAEVAAGGVHGPDARPFRGPWSTLPPVERGRHVMQKHWRCLASWTPEDWALDLAVFLDGRPVGSQQLQGDRFALRREVGSGSWLGLPWHGQGLGTEMRAAILHLAFAGLGAEDAVTEAFDHNHPSLAISRKLGYRPDGIYRDVSLGAPATTIRLRLTREDWEKSTPTPVTLHNLAPCKPLFGATT